MSLARWVNNKLIEELPTGQMVPPGGRAAEIWRQPDGGLISVASHSDAFDLHVAPKGLGGDTYRFQLDAVIAISIAKWLIRWWIFTMWFGLKPFLWRWSLNRSIKVKRGSTAA